MGEGFHGLILFSPHTFQPLVPPTHPPTTPCGGCQCCIQASGPRQEPETALRNWSWAKAVANFLPSRSDMIQESLASQHSLQNAPIFRLLLKVAVNGMHQCDFLNF